MSIIDILFHPRMIVAMLAFLGLSIATEIIGRKILLLLHDTTPTEWMFEHIFIPLARAIGLMIFILLCYPVLFGIQDAPPLAQLLATGSHRISTLMNVVFVLPLLFSLVPVLGSIPAFILPIQAIAGSSLIFSWMQAANSLQTIHYVPQIYIILIIIILAIMSHAVALWASNHLSNTVNQRWHINDGHKIVYRVVILIVQLPVILIYTQGLGAQL